MLDVGSGPGRDGLILKEKGLDVVCFDASDAMVALSTSRGLESVVGDFCALPFLDESFDGVWSYTALLHVPKAEVETAFSEIARILKIGGLFINGDKYARNEADLQAQDLESQIMAFDVFDTLSRSDLKKEWTEHYREDEKIKITEIPQNARIYYASVEQKEGSLYTTSSRAIACLGISENLEKAEVTSKAVVRLACFRFVNPSLSPTWCICVSIGTMSFEGEI